MEKNAEGKEAVTKVTLRPLVVIAGGTAPTDAGIARLHHAAHERCFLANSVRTGIVVEGSWRFA